MASSEKDDENQSTTSTISIINHLNNKTKNDEDITPTSSQSPYSLKRIKEGNEENSWYIYKLCKRHQEILSSIEMKHAEEKRTRGMLKELLEGLDKIAKIFMQFTASEKMMEEKRLLALLISQQERLQLLMPNINTAIDSLEYTLTSLKSTREYYIQELNALNAKSSELKTVIYKNDLEINSNILLIGQTIQDYASRPISGFEPIPIIIKLTSDEHDMLHGKEWDGRLFFEESDLQKTSISLGINTSSHKIEYNNYDNIKNAIDNNLFDSKSSKIYDKLNSAYSHLTPVERNPLILKIVDRNVNNPENKEAIEKGRKIINAHFAVQDEVDGYKLKNLFEETSSKVKLKTELTQELDGITKITDQFQVKVHALDTAIKRVHEYKEEMSQIKNHAEEISKSKECTADNWKLYEEGGSTDALLGDIMNIADLAKEMEDEIKEKSEDKETSSFRP